jgi:hypothetical protein
MTSLSRVFRARRSVRCGWALRRLYSDTVTVPFERFDELIVAEAIATAHTAQPSNIDIAALLSHGIKSVLKYSLVWLP